MTAEVIRRRYAAGLKNLFSLYLPLLTSWRLFDNSEPNRIVDIARGSDCAPANVYNEEMFLMLKGM